MFSFGFVFCHLWLLWSAHSAKFGWCRLSYYCCLYRFVYSRTCCGFSFSFGAVLTLFLARLSLGDSYHSGGCDISSAGWVGGVLTLDFGGLITLEIGGSMTGVLARVVLWCTRGSVLMTDGAVGCVDVW